LRDGIFSCFFVNRGEQFFPSLASRFPCEFLCKFNFVLKCESFNKSIDAYGHLNHYIIHKTSYDGILDCSKNIVNLVTRSRTYGMKKSEIILPALSEFEG